MDHIKFNVKAHNKISKLYKKKHIEIYNDIEQARLSDSLNKALLLINNNNQPIKALDLGCGVGNITDILVKHDNVIITSADIAENFLEMIDRKYKNTKKVHTLLINGEDLNNIEDNSFHFVGVYSVLHHIPDYLKTIQDMCRVVANGGVVYIDHERCEDYWNPNDEYRKFMEFTKPKFTPKIFLNLFNPKWYIRKYKKLTIPRYQTEGDIHVWKDDHIEWKEIEKILKSYGFDILVKEDYLSFISNYPFELYNEYKNNCTDMRILIARKK